MSLNLERGYKQGVEFAAAQGGASEMLPACNGPTAQAGERGERNFLRIKITDPHTTYAYTTHLHITII